MLFSTTQAILSLSASLMILLNTMNFAFHMAQLEFNVCPTNRTDLLLWHSFWNRHTAWLKFCTIGTFRRIPGQGPICGSSMVWFSWWHLDLVLMTFIQEQESVKNTDTPVNKLIFIPLWMKIEGTCMESSQLRLKKVPWIQLKLIKKSLTVVTHLSEDIRHHMFNAWVLLNTELWLCTSIHMLIITRDNGSEKIYVHFSARHWNAWLTSSAVTSTSLPTGNLAEKPAVQFLVALFLRYLKTP